MSGHRCPVCGTPGVPYQHATCKPCWKEVPQRLRNRLSVAWAARMRDPRGHREALIDLLQWAREFRVVTHG